MSIWMLVSVVGIGFIAGALGQVSYECGKSTRPYASPEKYKLVRKLTYGTNPEFSGGDFSPVTCTHWLYGDEGRGNEIEVTREGALTFIRSLPFVGGSGDTEGGCFYTDPDNNITKLVLVDERNRAVAMCNYPYANQQIVYYPGNCTLWSLTSTQKNDRNLTSGDGNTGFEGCACDPAKKKIYVIQEKSPMLIWELDVVTGIFTPMVWIEYLAPWRALITDMAGASFDPVNRSIYVLSQESKLVVRTTLTGEILGRPLSVDMATQPEGIHFEPLTGDLWIASEPNELFQFSANEARTDKVVASDGKAFEYFGYDVALGGDALVVSSIDHQEFGYNAGVVYVYLRDYANGGGWAYEKKLFPKTGSDELLFGYAVATDGKSVVVGARGARDRGPFSGAVYVFYTDNKGGWVEQAKLVASDGGAVQYFGESVDISGNTIVVGAYCDDDKGPYSGSAYVFVKNANTGTWSQSTKLLASDGAPKAYFGKSVAIDGDSIVVGAYADSQKLDRAGAAYVFVRDEVSQTWSQQTKLIAADGLAKDVFGSTVDISGDTVVVGAYWADLVTGTDCGAAYVFYRETNGTWTQQAKLVAYDAVSRDRFGNSVSIAGDLAVIGAVGSDDSTRGANTGSAYLFTRSLGTWALQGKLGPPDNSYAAGFGGSVAISGSIVAIGAVKDVTKGGNAGAAFVFTGTYPNSVQNLKQTSVKL